MARLTTVSGQIPKLLRRVNINEVDTSKKRTLKISMAETTTNELNGRKGKFVLILVLYLLGLFMGALDTGIITPARTVIQNDLGVDASTGIWMITIYTLFYAASIPIMGKLADVHGRKYVYLVSILLFGGGSLFCGLSNNFNSFEMLMVARAVQAVGGGGIMPVATAEFGTSFPPEKRGMALGIVGGVYGIANVFGASAGSLIMDIFGTENWSYIFFLNVPITVFIIILGLFVLKNNTEENTTKLDIWGILVLTAMVFALLYGLKTLDYFDFLNSIRDPQVYIYLIIFIGLLPIFIIIEKHAADPVINLSYFTDRNIAVALILALISGFVLMGVVYVPQLAENALYLATGEGGYLVICLGLFTGVAAPISGKLVDKLGAKIVLGAGFTLSAVGALFLVFITCDYPSMTTVLVGLGIIGLGMGFTMGTPLNYIMLANTDTAESNSSLATMSLVRSIGTAVAPAVLVGFLSHAGMCVQDNVMDVLPQKITVSQLPYAQEITAEFNELKEDSNVKENAKDIESIKIPDLNSMTSVDIGKLEDSDYKVPDDMIELLQNSDITTIVANIKTFSKCMFDDMSPDLIKDIDDGVSEGIDGASEGREQLDNAITKMKKGYEGITEGISGMNEGLQSMETAEKQLKSSRSMLKGFGKGSFPNNMSVADMIPAKVKKSMPSTAVSSLKKVKSLSSLNSQISALDNSIKTTNNDANTIKPYINQIASLDGGKLAEGQTLADLMGDDYNKLSNSTKGSISGVTTSSQLQGIYSGLSAAVSSQKTAKSQMDSTKSIIEQLANGNIPSGMSLLDFVPSNVRKQIPSDVKTKLSKVKNIKDLDKIIEDLQSSMDKLQKQLNEAKNSQKEMAEAMSDMREIVSKLDTMIKQMETLRDAVPETFQTAEADYIKAIDSRSDRIEEVFQETLNQGFKNIYLTVGIAAIVAILLLMVYSTLKEKERMESEFSNVAD